MKKEFQPKPSQIKEGKTKSNVKKNGDKGRQAPPPSPIKKDVPLFDQYTGEPNPLYEKLTGEPNPLLKSWKKEDFFNAPQNFQPKLKNRFLVVFPERLKMKPYFITDVKLPSVEIEKGIFGNLSVATTSLELTMIDSVDEPRLPVLFAWFKEYTKFDLVIEQLDPKNIVIQTFNLKDCLITRVDCQEMTYKGDESDLYKYKLSILPNSFNID